MTETFEWLDLTAATDDLVEALNDPPVRLTRSEFLRLAQQVCDEAERRNDADLKAFALRHVANEAIELRLDLEAESALLELLGMTNIDARSRGVAHRDLGRIRLSANPEEGFAQYTESVRALAESDDAEWLAHVLLEFGGSVGAAGDREAALEHFSRARDTARSIGRADLVARAEDRLAAAKWELGQAASAEGHLRTALHIATAIGDPASICFAKFRLGWKIADDLQSSDARRNEAFELLSAARSIAQENDDLATVAACDEKAAWVKADFDDYEGAIRIITAAISVFEATGNHGGALIARANLAGYLEESGDFDGCVRTLRNVIRDGKEIGDEYLVAAASTRLARRLLKIDRLEEANELLDSCADFFDSNDNKIEGVRFLLARAATYNRMGLVEATREAAQNVLESIERSVLPSFHAEALEYVADCLLVDGDRVRAESLFGQAVALYLVDDDLDEARRVAYRILPEPGEKISDLEIPSLATGVYL